MDMETIVKAKKIAKQNGESLSKLIERRLQELISNNKKKDKVISIADELCGIMSEPEGDYVTNKVKHLLKKHA